MRSAASLLEELRAVDESHTIEAKEASRIDRSVLETVCAFANEPGLGGGYLLLGVAPSAQPTLFSRGYDIVGVPGPDQAQSDLASQCASTFNRPVRPQVAVEQLDGKAVLVVLVPELSPAEKPLYLKSLGLPRGAYRRIGSTDQEGTEDDLIALYQGHQVDTYDGAVQRDADLSDIDPEAVRLYRELRAAANPVAEELTWSDPDLLRALGAAVLEDGVLRPTVAGLLLFGTGMALRRCFPMMRIDYVRVPGREWVQDPDRRFDTVEIRAPLIVAARRAIAAVRDDLPASFSLPEGEAMRSDETILPVRVLREAVVNAVMHRSYRIHGPIQILRYANRLEVRNPGHSLKAEEQLGEPGSQTRNPRVAAVLHDVHLAETKGSGIRAMRELMVAQDLLPPTFESTRRPDQFVATFLFHHFLGEADLAWLRRVTAERLSDEEARALVFVREVGAIDNAAYRSINRVDTLSASAHLRRLRDLDLLEMKGAGNRTYYIPGPGIRGAEPTPSAPDLHHPATEVHQPRPDLHQVPDELRHLSESLRERLLRCGTRPRQDVLRTLIRDLCASSPHSARALARLLGDRDPKNLVRLHLQPMLAAGDLAYTIPEMPNHPDQKYTTPETNPA
ncbi:MAG: putative DNA binding domain-containing protein [Alphaproteobacteria bacterium]|nr:putative DNA binding domain-containing protein [Alphaproteobacteria bacterium]